MENLYTKDCIRTVSGIYINVFDPHPDMITIEDIAHALSRQCRFAGHLPRFYSVAEHSWLCANLVSPKNKLAGLLHDASEAFILDMPKPIKDGLPEYKKIENNLMKVIAKKFDFQYPLDKEIKEIDLYLLEAEWNEIMLDKRPIKVTYCLDSTTAKLTFLDMFHQLQKEKVTT